MSDAVFFERREVARKSRGRWLDGAMSRGRRRMTVNSREGPRSPTSDPVTVIYRRNESEMTNIYMSSSCPIEMYCLVILLVRELATKTSETHQGCWRRIYGLDFRWDYWWRRKIRRLWWNDVFRSPTENLMVHQGSTSKAKSTITTDEIKWLTNQISHQDNISYKDKRKTKAKWNDFKFIQNRRRKHTTHFPHDNIDNFHWLCSV